MYCSKCGTKLEENDIFCVSCGHDIHQKTPKNKWLIIGICTSIIAVISIFIVIILLFKNIQNNTKQIVEEPEPPKIEQLTQMPIEAPVDEDKKEKTQIIKESMPKVFTVITGNSQGSGFLYKDGGYIVTNAHVVAGFTDVILRNHAGQESPAVVIGISDRTDVALLHSQEYANAQPFEIEKEETAIGTEVIAIGSPQGLENSASIGYLTGTNRDYQLDFVYEGLYQIDAQISEGSSGGPLLDGKTGKVIGINSLLYTPNNSFGFSIPLYTVTPLIEGWIREPMSKTAVASLFDAYADYNFSNEEEQYYEEYEEYWDYYSEDSSEEDYNEEYWNEYSYSFDEESLTNFILAFRDYYELALYYKDFYWIADMLLPNSTAYLELEEYLYDISGEEYFFDFLSNTITNIEMYDDYALVSTNEQFNFYDATGAETFFDRYKVYTVIINGEGYYQITDIYINE